MLIASRCEFTWKSLTRFSVQLLLSMRPEMTLRNVAKVSVDSSARWGSDLISDCKLARDHSRTSSSSKMSIENGTVRSSTWEGTLSSLSF